MKQFHPRLFVLLPVLVAAFLLPGCTNTGTGATAVRQDSDLQTVWGSGSGSGKPINGPGQDHAGTPSR